MTACIATLTTNVKVIIVTTTLAQVIISPLASWFWYPSHHCLAFASSLLAWSSVADAEEWSMLFVCINNNKPCISMLRPRTKLTDNILAKKLLLLWSIHNNSQWDNKLHTLCNLITTNHNMELIPRDMKCLLNKKQLWYRPSKIMSLKVITLCEFTHNVLVNFSTLDLDFF